MQNNNQYKLYSLQAVLPMYRRLFGKEADLYDMLELAPYVLREGGGYKMGTYLTKSTVTDNEVKLPCELDKIRSVTLSYPLTYYFATPTILAQENIVSGITNTFSTQNTEDFPNRITSINSWLLDYNKNTITGSLGPLIDFKWEDKETISFNSTGMDVDIIYDTVLVDEEDGYPVTDDKTLTALAYYMNYVDVQKMFFQKLADGNMFNMALQLKDKHMAKARSGHGFTDNELDKIMNVMTSFNRKRYNYNIKF